jgi:hypothetical protein
MDALRTELREYFWDGEFRDTVGATVLALPNAEGRRQNAGIQHSEGKPHHPYAVFISRKTGKAGVVIANYDEKQSVTVQTALDNGQALGRYRLVDDPAWRSTADGIVLPPMSAAVVIECP